MNKNIQLRLIIILWVIFFINTGIAAQQTKDTTLKKTDSLVDVRAVLLSKDMEKTLIRSSYAANNNEWKKVKDFSVFTFDFNSLAMHVDQGGLNKKLNILPDSTNRFYESGEIIIRIGYNTLLWEITFEERPMYFDYEGYVYTKGNGKKS